MMDGFDSEDRRVIGTLLIAGLMMHALTFALLAAILVLK